MSMPQWLRFPALGVIGLLAAGLVLGADDKEVPASSKELLAKLKDYKHKIVYETNRDGNWELYLVNADGSNPVNLTNTKDVDELYPKPPPMEPSCPSSPMKRRARTRRAMSTS
jgi:hypothetical protein